MRKFSLAATILLFTITSYSQVQEVWAKISDATTNTDMVVNSSGNVFILSGGKLLKYDKNGNNIWTRSISMFGVAMAIDATENIYVVAEMSDHYLTAKFNSSGYLDWSTPYLDDEEGTPADIAVDLDGNVYVTGESSTGELSDEELSDYATVKYDHHGTQIWARRFNGASPGSGFDAGKSLTVDAIGNIYVTGISQKDGQMGAATLKYSPAGVELWLKRYEGANGENDDPTEIKLDAAGNVFVTGLSTKIEGGAVAYENPFVVKYTFGGFELWSKRLFSDTDGQHHETQGLLIDALGNIIVTGHSYAFPFFVKYSPAGDRLWFRSIAVFGLSGDATTDGSNIYYVGNTTELGFTTLKLDANGTEQWRVGYAGNGGTHLIGVDALQNVYTSNTSSTPGNNSAVIIRYAQCRIIGPEHTIFIDAEPGSCGAIINYSITTTGDCGELEYPENRSPGSFLNVGHYHMVVKSPSTGDSIKFIIDVVDNELPQMTYCPPDKTLNVQPGVCYVTSANVNAGVATATDNCPDRLRIVGIRSDGLTLADDYPVGVTTITWTAKDIGSNTATCLQTITIIDNIPPTISGEAASTYVLSPSNHTMRDVSIDYTISDNCYADTTITITSNEPINGVGDGDTDPDWIIIDKKHFQLRAERAANGTGRTYTITITATDPSGNTAIKTIEVKVPHNIKNPHSGKAYIVNSAFPFEGEFWDKAGNTHTAKWLIDGSTTAKATITEPSGNKNGKVSGSYKFTSPGIYKLQMNVTDQTGVTHYTNTAGDLEAIVVIYDPNGGNTYGGGYYNSPAGALKSNFAATGKASYGFAMNYFKNSTNPKGETQFDFKVGDFEFNALNFEYLVISNSMAQFKGTGKIIGGQSGIGFTMTVVDGDIDGTGVDKIRMKIYNRNTGEIIYDNQQGASDAALPIQPVGENSIVVISGTSSAPVTANRTENIVTESKSEEVSNDFNVAAFPNPSSSHFMINVKGNGNEKITMQVVDMYGRIIETRNVTENSIIKFGDRYRPGTYFVKVIQGKEHKEIKLIKLSD
ncbi:MAG: SBBP repeat-containing protein [Chitinophagaceae bacterium]